MDSCFRSLSTAATPYLLLEVTRDKTRSGEEAVVELNLYYPKKDGKVKIPDQTLTKELLTSSKIGSSRGWVVAKNLYDSTLRLTNMFNPSASASSRKVIPLPPTSERLCRISLSASPDQEDCVVAAMSTGSSLVMCRPGDSDWTPVRTTFSTSEMIFSDGDGKFYLHRVGNEECNEEWNREEYEASCSKEPPYEPSYKKKPRTFVVFRQDLEQRISSYTEDIGDLCIFLGSNEPFCVSATEYPGLKPNSVYFSKYNTGFGFNDLSSNTVHDVIHPYPSYCSNTWMAPLQ